MWVLSWGIDILIKLIDSFLESASVAQLAWPDSDKNIGVAIHIERVLFLLVLEPTKVGGINAFDATIKPVVIACSMAVFALHNTAFSCV